MKYFCISLGCPKNRVDTERLLGSFSDVEMTENILDAELVLVNTCAFIQPAIQESVRTILTVADDIKELSNRPLFAVAGCLSGRFDTSELSAEIPEVDIWLTPNELESWSEQLAHIAKIPLAQEKGRIISTLPSYAWLKIGDGCRHRCSFCTIPSIRGKQHSYTKEFLVDEARRAVSSGVKEIILVAQDVTAWQEQDKQKPDLRPLLDELVSIEELKRIRLMYLYPSGLTDELLLYMSEADKKVLPYFDVPLQHADETILKKMGRPFAGNPYKTIEKIRHYIPDAALRTSFIVGFPTETEEQYNNLCAFVEEVRFNNLGVFAYQAEEGTVAAQMPDQIDDTLKEWRRDNLMEIQAEISEEILSQYLGSSQELLIDSPLEEWDGLYSSRTWFQAPEVDGITYISGENITTGQLVTAEIVETKEYDLVALCTIQASMPIVTCCGAYITKPN